MERVREKSNERLVRGAFDRRGVEPNLDGVAMNPRDPVGRRTRLHSHGNADTGWRWLNSKRTQTRPMAPCSNESSRKATSGERSSGPNGGNIRRKGASIHSVSTYDQRIHFE